MSQEKIEAAFEKFEKLFTDASGVPLLDIEWMLKYQDDEGLRQQQANVELLLEIAYDRGLRKRPELAEAIAEIKRNGLAYADAMRKYRANSIAKSGQHRYLVVLSEYHDAMVGHCRRLCGEVYPSRLRLFDICFGAI